MQTLKFENISFEMSAPENIVLVPKQEYGRLVENDLSGKTWTMNDLRERLGNVDARVIREKVLYPYRKELDVLNGGFVVYHKKTGSPWKFQASKMAKFIDEHWKLFLTL
ncbi:DUF771 domain-containing protein [Enterococcus hirae]|nr:DUF771 domain-containing protein [Enterococcus hirae]EMF0253218.1 DUF771 domain-containing protein [Enterococcus hirae]